MCYYLVNIEKKTLENNSYRRVLSTDKNQQLVVMSLQPMDDIPKEKHQGTQFFRIESGEGLAIIKKKIIKLRDGMSLTVPPNTLHAILNISSKTPLKLYSIYSPPQHAPDAVDKVNPELQEFLTKHGLTNNMRNRINYMQKYLRKQI